MHFAFLVFWLFISAELDISDLNSALNDIQIDHHFMSIWHSSKS